MSSSKTPPVCFPAPPAVVPALPATFAARGMDDVQRALVAILNLFHQLAIAVAHDLHYAYPAEAHAEVLSWMQQHMPPPKPAE